jgi:hypothetical protein
LSFEHPTCAPVRQRPSPRVVSERLGNEESVDENSFASRTNFIAFLGGDALQDRHIDRQVTACGCKLSDWLWEMRENPIALGSGTRGNEYVPAPWRALAWVVYQAARRVSPCRNRNRCEADKHDGDNAIGRFHTSASTNEK